MFITFIAWWSNSNYNRILFLFLVLVKKISSVMWNFFYLYFILSDNIKTFLKYKSVFIIHKFGITVEFTNRYQKKDATAASLVNKFSL